VSHGLVVALKAEARAILGRGRWEGGTGCAKRSLPLKRLPLPDGFEVMATLSGMGREKAAAGAEFLAGKGVSSLISVGLAGGLSPDMKAGEIILASTIIDEYGGEFNSTFVALDFASEILEENGLKSRQGLLVSTEKALLDVAAKSALYEKTGALAIDMESVGVAAAAAKSGLPFFVMRVVCDEADESISNDLYECLGEGGEVKTGRLIGSCLKRPSMVAEMMGLRRSYVLALSTMGRAWKILLQEGLLSVFSL